jgi:hypothetical protein
LGEQGLPPDDRSLQGIAREVFHELMVLDTAVY